jgi:hypothetical protein
MSKIILIKMAIFGCAAALMLSACGAPKLEAVGEPIEFPLESPEAVLEGGFVLDSPDLVWDGYGEAVDVNGDVLVVGAAEWNQVGPGSAYVYRRSGQGWRQEARLITSDLAEFEAQASDFASQRLGTSVALGEGIVAVGAPANTDALTDRYAGAVYLFDFDGESWVETAKLTAEQPDSAEIKFGMDAFARFRPSLFGSLVALDGDTLAVGGDSGAQSVYVYQRNIDGWQEQARLQIPGRPGKELYMASMDLFGDTLALSAFYVLPFDAEKLELMMIGNVVVHVFERTGETWKESFHFVSEEGEEDLLFLPELNVGASVALDGAAGRAERMAVGLPGFPDWSQAEDNVGLFGANAGNVPDLPGSNRQAGAVYLFERSEHGWKQTTILRPGGWEDPPGVGLISSWIPATPEGEQSESAAGDGLLSAAGITGAFVFPGHIYSEKPEISFFGATVDLDGEQLAVTAGYANGTYVFERRGEEWVYKFRLFPGQTAKGGMEDFAQVVSIDGCTLLLGTPGEFGATAHVFDICPE